MSSNSLIQIQFELPSTISEITSALLFQAGVDGVEEKDNTTFSQSVEGMVTLTVTMNKEGHLLFLDNFKLLSHSLFIENGVDFGNSTTKTEIPIENWEESWRDKFDLVKLGRFTVKPYWIDYTPQKGETILHIEPGLAFGTGLHATTKLCVEQLCYLSDSGFKPSSVLDMGCGTGILAMVTAHLWKSEIDGVEIDTKALSTAADILKANSLEDRIYLYPLPPNKQYDLIIANINALTLLELSTLIKSLLKPKGKLVLSGITKDKSIQVENRYSMEVEKKVSADEWVLLQMK
jgi:ribosomal protein L11 methyltransferase